ncbi:hypothetical protein U0G65_29865 [Bacillus thuringiensis]|nr:hypothetical protein [Bacillus thuringiensis]MDY8166190.1 hypothetical protein [Bacillus thuringiensis]
MTLNRWLTNKEYWIAHSNGISRRTLYMRVYKYGWELQEALTIPPRTYWHIGEGKFNKLLKIAEENGISASTFRSRVSTYGWDPEKAATTPARGKRVKKNIS